MKEILKTILEHPIATCIVMYATTVLVKSITETVGGAGEVTVEGTDED